MVITWLLCRHILYNMLVWSIFKSVPSRMAYGCYSGATAEMISTDGYLSHMFSPFRDLDGPICMNRTIKWTFLSFLLSIQSLSIVWFTMIIRVIVGVVRTGNAEDTRSDGEEDELLAEGKEELVEKAVVVGNGSAIKDGANASAEGSPSSSSSTTTRIRSNGSATVRTSRGRVRLGDQNDRKALLGRIGCEKPVSS